VPSVNLVAVYCLVQNKTRRMYDRAMVPLAAPELILLDFESAAISAFRAAFLTQLLTKFVIHLSTVGD